MWFGVEPFHCVLWRQSVRLKFARENPVVRHEPHAVLGEWRSVTEDEKSPSRLCCSTARQPLDRRAGLYMAAAHKMCVQDKHAFTNCTE
jgi:hypothetical protein